MISCKIKCYQSGQIVCLRIRTTKAPSRSQYDQVLRLRCSKQKRLSPLARLPAERCILYRPDSMSGWEPRARRRRMMDARQNHAIPLVQNKNNSRAWKWKHSAGKNATPTVQQALRKINLALCFLAVDKSVVGLRSFFSLHGAKQILQVGTGKAYRKPRVPRCNFEEAIYGFSPGDVHRQFETTKRRRQSPPKKRRKNQMLQNHVFWK